MVVIGLTGSIGMGKSTTAALFAAEGVPIYDADAAVHRLYAGVAVGPVGEAFPGVVVGGVVDRKRLGAAVVGNPQALARLEAVVHPLVAADRAAFVERERDAGTEVVVLDVPLLFETGGTRDVDVVVVVSAPLPVQKARVMARQGMTDALFQSILARQTPDAEKRARADVVIDTGSGIEAAREAVRRLLARPRANGTARDA